MMAGRDISASKMAFSSARVMGTCAVGGQAVGTAAALAVRWGCTPREVGEKHIVQLQQQLLKDDCYIPGFANCDEGDLARAAAISATSESGRGPASSVINGVARTVGDAANCWESAPLGEGGETLTLKLAKASPIREVRLTFDTDLSHEIMPSITRIVRERQVKGLPRELVKDYAVSVWSGGEKVWEKRVENNGQRLNILRTEGAAGDEVRVTVLGTHGLDRARIYEVRIY